MRIISFTDKGQHLAEHIACELGGSWCRCGEGASLADWTREGFEHGEDLVFVGAAGIAVRAIAPHIVHKAQDPAVVVVDECALHAIALLSGHLGGANELARRVATCCGATPVIMTATDCNGVFAIDTWAKSCACVVENPERIKHVSAKLLAGKPVVVATELPIEGEPPAGVAVVDAAHPEGSRPDALVSWQAGAPSDVLHIVPRAIAIGVGCRRGVPFEVIEHRFERFCAERNIAMTAVKCVCSIDLKADEPGLRRFCAEHGWPFKAFNAEELAAAEGEFSASSFVASTVGVDNVCERAAVLGSGGELVARKDAGDGVTLAAALAPVSLHWPEGDGDG